MEHHTTTSRAEAERLLGIAEKLLRSKDYGGSRDFAILAQETEPLLDGSDQILAVAEVLLAAENKRLSNNQNDWYSILQIPQRTEDTDLIKKQYRRLALLLHPDKNKFPFSDSAFRLVADSWAVLSDPSKKAVFDNEFSARFTKVDLVAMKKQQQQKRQQQREDNSQKLPVRRSSKGATGSGGGGNSATPTPIPTPTTPGAGVKVNTRNASANSLNFWTTCPYCYNLYEYSRVYEGCCIRCDNENCKKAFTAAEILSMPPVVAGKEAYYCCWGFFPMGFAAGGNEFPKWMPPMFENGGATGMVEEDNIGEPPQDVTPEAAPVTPAAPAPAPVAPAAPAPAPVEPASPVPAPVAPAASSTARKRGRPKKNV